MLSEASAKEGSFWGNALRAARTTSSQESQL